MLGRLLSYDTDDLYYNLAIEHAVLYLYIQSDYIYTLRFWKNPKSVVIGRNQDLREEVNEKYCKENEILIGRRISGGGAVFEDNGVLNISFFVPRERIPKPKNRGLISVFFTELLLKSLESIGINNLERDEESNILYKGQKVSGSAGYYRSKWVLHHATLLISANLEHLNHSLKARSRIPSKKGQSRYLPTTNIPAFDVGKWQELVKTNVEEHFNIPLAINPLTFSIIFEQFNRQGHKL